MSLDPISNAILETLAYAIEASHSYDTGYLDCARALADGIARALGLSEHERDALNVAALMHNVGRLSVPQHIIHKNGSLTFDEKAKLRLHPVTAASLVAAMPFPFDVAPMVRHYTEHWNGSGYPDRLNGPSIPAGARILAVACAYSAMRHPRAFRPAHPAHEAMEVIERGAGEQFDPVVVSALRVVVEAVERLQEMAAEAEPASELKRQSRAALDAIVAAQRETIGLFALAEATTQSLHVEAVAETLLTHTRGILPNATCVLFLPDEGGEYLRAYSARGSNERHLLGSLARVGAYLTGRAFTRGEYVQTSFLHNDLILRDVSDPWISFRSTLIVPLKSGSATIGTLNLYAEEQNAFGEDTLRVVRMIATLAGRALDNARRFADVQETAYTDALTGLRNARYLREFLEREINRAQRENTPLAVLNIDLDNFKPINDTYGHLRGDQTLREVANILSDHIRSYDLAVRYAGDEFVVVLSRAGRVPAETVAAKLKSAVERHGMALHAADTGFPILGISVGVALFPDDADDLQGLLCRSDAAMYSDKQGRRMRRTSEPSLRVPSEQAA